MTRPVVGLPKGCGDAEVSQEDGTVIIDEEVGRLDIAVDESIDVQIAGKRGASVEARYVNRS